MGTVIQRRTDPAERWIGEAGTVLYRFYYRAMH